MSTSLRRAAGLALALVGSSVSGLMGQAASPPTITLGGVVYAQYLYQFNKDSSLTPAAHQNNFDITRAYLNAIGKFGSTLTTRVTIDVDGRKAASNQLSFRLKYAYVAWTPENSRLTYKIGQIHTPLLDWEEALWDYRMQGPMALERGGYVSSSDFGAGVDGNWGYDKLNLQVGVFNGENYSGAPGDQRKDVMGRVSYKILNTDLPGRVGGLRITGYAQYGKPTTGGRRERYLGMISYKSKMLTLAGEIAATRDSVTGAGTATPAAANKTGRIYSAFGVLNVPNSRFGLLARVDITDPVTGSGSTRDRQTRLIGGVSYQLTPNLRLLADVDHVTRQGGNYANGFNATRSTGYFQTQFTF